MKTFLKELWTSILATVVLCVVVSGVYPVLVWGIGQVLFPYQANGSLIERNGQIVGSELLAQGFSGAKYFHPRPSAAGAGYDPLNSGGSNLGPTSKALIDRVDKDVAAARKAYGIAGPLPADMVTASASGLDPDVSVETAMAQVPAVAKARGLGVGKVSDLVGAHV